MKNWNFIKAIVPFAVSLFVGNVFADTVTVPAPTPPDASSSSAQPAAGATPPAASSAPQPGSSSGPAIGGSQQPAGQAPAGGAAQPQANAQQPAVGQPQAGGAQPGAQPPTANGAQPQSTSPQPQGAKPSAPATQPATQASSSAQPASDSTITTSIQTSIATNNDVKTANIDVSSKDGKVKLVGSVASNAQASTLIEIAASTAGVKDVDVSKLIINNHQKISKDSIITAKVKGVLIREKLVGPEIINPITVQSQHGEVTLTGTVSNQAQADKAVKLAQGVPDVHTVNSKLVVIEENNQK